MSSSQSICIPKMFCVFKVFVVATVVDRELAMTVKLNPAKVLEDLFISLVPVSFFYGPLSKKQLWVVYNFLLGVFYVTALDVN